MSRIIVRHPCVQAFAAGPDRFKGATFAAAREAIARGIAQEMRRDESVVFLGEDVGAAGGVFKGTVGLLEEFGGVRGVGAGCHEVKMLDWRRLDDRGDGLIALEERGKSLVPMLVVDRVQGRLAKVAVDQKNLAT